MILIFWSLTFFERSIYLTNRKCKIGKKAYAARRIAAIMMSATLAGAIVTGTPGIVQVSAATYSENADYIFEVLTQKLGYSEAAACGIMANIRCESTFNPHAWNAGGGSYGLCQWTGGRYGRLQSWCRSNGYDYTTIDGQLAYLEYELESHYRGVEEYLRSVENTSDGAYQAGQYYCYHFEAPASRGSVSVYRGGLASGTFWEAYRPAEWYAEDGVWHYIKRDGTYHTSWLTIDNKTYYLDENGNRISGWRTIDGNRYYFDSDGVMASGWVKIDGKSYYFQEDGPLVTGLVLNDESWYMLDESGKIQASQKMDHFAGQWNEQNSNEVLASAEEETADGNLTADAGAEDGAAALQDNTYPSLTAMAPANGEENKDSAPALLGIGASEAVSLLKMPSLPSAGDKAAEDADPVDASDSGQEEANLSATIYGLEDTPEDTAEDEGRLEDTAEDSADTDEMDDPAALADNGSVQVQTEQKTEEAAEAVTDASTAVISEDTEDSEESEESAQKTAETAQEAATADTAAQETTAEDTAQEAVTADPDAQETTSDDTAEEAADEDSAAQDVTEENTSKEASTADTEDQTQEEKETAQETPDEDFTDEEKTENASIGAITSDSYEEEAEIASIEDREEKTELAGFAFSEEFLRKYSSEGSTSGFLGETLDEFNAAEALRAAAQATSEEAEEEENPDGVFMFYEPASAEDQSGNKIDITLSDTIPFMNLEDLDEIVKLLDEQDILHAVTSDGTDITDQVKSTYEKIDPRGNAYKVVFTVSCEGKTASLESTVYVNN